MAVCLFGAVGYVGCDDTSGPTLPPGPDPIVSIVIDAPDSLVAVSGAVQLSATVLDSGGNEVQGETITWTTDDPNVAAITSGGVLSGLDQGSVQVTASVGAVTGNASFRVHGFQIGAAGGTAYSDDGRASADIPANALSGSVQITVTSVDDATLPNDPEYVPGTGHDFGPSGQSFLGTIRLNMIYNPALLPPGVSETSLTVHELQGGVWVPLPGAIIDTAANTVSGETTHFSIYGVVGDTTAAVQTNTAPQAAITAPANGATFNQGQSVTFQGTGQDDQDGSLTGASLAWTSSLDGALGTGESLSTSALSNGNHAVTLTVTDADGVSDTAQISISVAGGSCGPANADPDGSIESPNDDDAFASGTMITFEGYASDPEDGDLTGSAIQWTSNLDGAIGEGETFQTNALSVGRHRIKMTPTDSCGNTDPQIVIIFVN